MANTNTIQRTRENLERSIEMYEANIQRAMNRLDALDTFPEDDCPEGAIIAFEKVIHGKTYHYAALKVNGLWYTTGPRAPKGYTWAEMAEWLLSGTATTELWIVTDLEEL